MFRSCLAVTDTALESGLKLKFYTSKTQSLNNPHNLKYLGYEKDTNFLKSFQIVTLYWCWR